MFTSLYKSLVRPHLEYAHSVWHPSLKKHKILLENVQRRATKQLQCCKNMEYPDRLRYLNVPCLVHRKLRGDMIELFKITHGNYDTDLTSPIEISKSTTRGNKIKIKKPSWNKKIRKNFFSIRAANTWNSLPNDVTNSPTIMAFESSLDNHLEQFNIKFEFDRCILFEQNSISGLGNQHLKDIYH